MVDQTDCIARAAKNQFSKLNESTIWKKWYQKKWQKLSPIANKWKCTSVAHMHQHHIAFEWKWFRIAYAIQDIYGAFGSTSRRWRVVEQSQRSLERHLCGSSIFADTVSPADEWLHFDRSFTRIHFLTLCHCHCAHNRIPLHDAPSHRRHGQRQRCVLWFENGKSDKFGFYSNIDETDRMPEPEFGVSQFKRNKYLINALAQVLNSASDSSATPWLRSAQK